MVEKADELPEDEQARHDQERQQDVSFHDRAIAVARTGHWLAVAIGIATIVATVGIGIWARSDSESAPDPGVASVATPAAVVSPSSTDLGEQSETKSSVSSLGGQQVDRPDASERRLKLFVRQRTDVPAPCAARHPSLLHAVAQLDCTVDHRTVEYIQFRDEDAALDYFAVRAAPGDVLDGSFGECYGSWTEWNDSSGHSLGKIAFRRARDRTEVVWTYARHQIVAYMATGKGQDTELCQVWNHAA